ncbi:multidrug resistance-associated protein 4 isoform X2 [Folsomia candida]|uniref:multidrug resistance-associated protein 4 isoform X2 n=1 Tax=Folsomia candida TaxID=158441 RepID=UPI001604FAC0|nr:multidrug resistance-associated protein 4 isoform X2 [Folsomia candida]
MDSTKTILVRNPFSKASYISKLFFWWLFPLLKQGKHSDLKTEDIYETLREDESNNLGDLVESAWSHEKYTCAKKGKKPNLLRPLLALFGRKFLIICGFYCLDGWIVVVSQPIFLRLLIKSFGESDAVKESWEPYVYTAGICISTFLHVIILHPCDFVISHIGMKCRVGLSALIYRKALRLHSKSESSVGYIINILSNDVSRFDTSLNFIPFIVVGPIQFVIFMVLLWQEIAISSLSGVVLIILLIPLNYFLGKILVKFRQAIVLKTDRRCNLMNDIILGIRIIKMYAWEQPFSAMVDLIRKNEVKDLRKRGVIRGLHHAAVSFAPKLVPFGEILTYYLLGNELSADKVFFILTVLYTIIQVSVYCIPQAVSGIGELIVSIKRIEEFLLFRENQKLSIGDRNYNSSDPRNSYGVKLVTATTCWSNGTVALNRMSVDLAGDKVVMIVGSVGSGKTAFLQSLLSELTLRSGSISANGVISYASQEAWIFSGDIRQNITFGTKFDDKRYDETISACSLGQDFTQLPYGDRTLVGESGVGLSGGQKVRVNLARAVYRKADIYLFDDPLSAVDSSVSRHIFENCIKSYLKGSLRILVTHQLHYLPLADHIIVLKEGSITASGTYQELMEEGIAFMSHHASSADEQNRQQSLTNEIREYEDNARLGKPLECHEEQNIGSVTYKNYLGYFTSAKSPILLSLLALSFVLSQFLLNGTDYWLGFWTNETRAKNPQVLNEEKSFHENTYIFIYSGLVALGIIFCVARALLFYEICARISSHLHDDMFTNLVRAPTKFFDDNPSGRVMNRFTRDIGAIDDMLPTAFADTVAIFLSMFGVSVIVILSNYFLTIPTVILFVSLFFIRQYFVTTSRSLKRIESITRSPILSHLSVTMQGLDTIRAFKSQSTLMKQFDSHHDLHSAAWFLFIAVNRWFGIWLELASVMFLVFVTIGFLFVESTGSNVGIAIASTLTLTGSFQWGMRQSAETENFMTCVQRILDYIKIKPEASLKSTQENQPPKHWPNQGQINFQNVSLSYTEEKQSLKNLTFEIKSQEKIGIVGRTGAGKSSIITSFLRLVEPNGTILIDGVDIKKIGLHDLRKNISIIPQDPHFFTVSLRFNLDPFNEFSDNELWSVLGDVDLANSITDLDMDILNGGSNFSIGQRQLVCLARTILRRNRIILIDEATANVDETTDKFIQNTLRSKFKHCTIITVAHRLNTVIDCDKILVLDDGLIKEYDHPHALLMNKDGLFTAMVAKNGESELANMRRIAAESFERNEIPDEMVVTRL